MRGCAPNHKHSIFITSHIQQHILRSLKSVSFTPACAEFHFTSHDVLISLITRGVHSHPFEANQAHKHNFKKICERAACVRMALWNWQTHISEFNIQVYQFHGRCGLWEMCFSLKLVRRVPPVWPSSQKKGESEVTAGAAAWCDLWRRRGFPQLQGSTDSEVTFEIIGTICGTFSQSEAI